MVQPNSPGELIPPPPDGFMEYLALLSQNGSHPVPQLLSQMPITPTPTPPTQTRLFTRAGRGTGGALTEKLKVSQQITAPALKRKSPVDPDVEAQLLLTPETAEASNPKQAKRARTSKVTKCPDLSGSLLTKLRPRVTVNASWHLQRRLGNQLLLQRRLGNQLLLQSHLGNLPLLLIHSRARYASQLSPSVLLTLLDRSRPLLPQPLYGPCHVSRNQASRPNHLNRWMCHWLPKMFSRSKSRTTRSTTAAKIPTPTLRFPPQQATVKRQRLLKTQPPRFVCCTAGRNTSDLHF